MRHALGLLTQYEDQIRKGHVAARTLIRHLGGEGNVVFLTDRALFAGQAIKHVLGLDESEVVVRVEDDRRQQLDCDLLTIWLAPGEDLTSVEPSALKFDNS